MFLKEYESFVFAVDRVGEACTLARIFFKNQIPYWAGSYCTYTYCIKRNFPQIQCKSSVNIIPLGVFDTIVVHVFSGMSA